MNSAGCDHFLLQSTRARKSSKVIDHPFGRGISTDCRALINMSGRTWPVTDPAAVPR